jgi:hypothetical protein
MLYAPVQAAEGALIYIISSYLSILVPYYYPLTLSMLVPLIQVLGMGHVLNYGGKTREMTVKKIPIART